MRRRTVNQTSPPPAGLAVGFGRRVSPGRSDRLHPEALVERRVRVGLPLLPDEFPRDGTARGQDSA